MKWRDRKVNQRLEAGNFRPAPARQTAVVSSDCVTEASCGRTPGLPAASVLRRKGAGAWSRIKESSVPVLPDLSSLGALPRQDKTSKI